MLNISLYFFCVDNTTIGDFFSLQLFCGGECRSQGILRGSVFWHDGTSKDNPLNDLNGWSSRVTLLEGPALSLLPLIPWANPAHEHFLSFSKQRKSAVNPAKVREPYTARSSCVLLPN